MDEKCKNILETKKLKCQFCQSVRGVYKYFLKEQYEVKP